MSVTTPFRFARGFPFCVKDHSSDLSGVSYLSGLTATQVGTFAWNLETFTISTAGTATSGGNTVDGNGSFTLNTTTGTIYNRGGGGGMWVTKGSSNVALNTSFGSWPAAVIPIDRICYDDGSRYQGTLIDVSFNDSSNPSYTFGSILFVVATDPLSPGYYRLYYYISMVYGISGGGSPSLVFNSTPVPGIGGGTPFSSGNITIGGLTFPWASAYSGTSTTGTGAMTASSSNYTY